MAFDDEEHPYLPKHILNRQRRNSSVTVLVIAGLMASKCTLSITSVSINLLSMQNSSTLTVPGGSTVVCSTTKSVEWDVA
ncbi:hypothetical protein Droror1_Dr00020428 [Drosera rotundifolia]